MVRAKARAKWGSGSGPRWGPEQSLWSGGLAPQKLKLYIL